MTSQKSPVIFVPGIGGSTLGLKNRTVWGRRNNLIRDFDFLELPGTPLHPGHVWEELVLFPPLAHHIYGPFINYLCNELGYERNRDLFLFAYDWRQDCRDSARALQNFILEKVAPFANQNIRFTVIAHSMGGLVARYCSLLPDMKAQGYIQQIIAVGTPHYGCPSAWRALQDGAAIFPGGFRQQDTIRAVRSFPSIYQLLPTLPGYVEDPKGDKVNLYDIANWDWLTGAQQLLLRQAAEFHRELMAERSSTPIFSICGNGQPTLEKIVVERRRNKYRWDRARYTMRIHGDGTVPFASAILESGPNCFVITQGHDSLLDDAGARNYIRELLVRGSASQPSGETRGATHRLLVDVLNLPYSAGGKGTVRFGLLDEHDKVVQGAQFHVELHKLNEDGESLARLWEADVSENLPTDQSKLIVRGFDVPRTPGTYRVIVALVKPRVPSIQTRKKCDFSVTAHS